MYYYYHSYQLMNHQCGGVFVLKLVLLSQQDCSFSRPSMTQLLMGASTPGVAVPLPALTPTAPVNFCSRSDPGQSSKSVSASAPQSTISVFRANPNPKHHLAVLQQTWDLAADIREGFGPGRYRVHAINLKLFAGFAGHGSDDRPGVKRVVLFPDACRRYQHGLTA